MTPTVWADVRCPWCWMGHRSLAAALERRDRREPVVRASYLLDPHGEGHPGRTVREVALASWGMDEDGWRAMRDRVETAGRAFGLRIRMDGVPAIDSRPAHRLLKLAHARGVDPEHAWDLAFSALLEHNRDLGDPEVLRDLAVEMGLTAEDTDPLWSSTHFAAEVDDETADLVVLALIAAHRRAGDLAALLDRLARTARAEAAMRTRILASRARVRASARLISGTAITITAVLILLSPEFLTFYDTVIGQAALAVVFAVFAHALVWLARMGRYARPARLIELGEPI